MEKYIGKTFTEVFKEIKEIYYHWSYEMLNGEEYVAIWSNDDEEEFIGRLIIDENGIISKFDTNIFPV